MNELAILFLALLAFAAVGLIVWLNREEPEDTAGVAAGPRQPNSDVDLK